jgi:hypothetical protein
VPTSPPGPLPAEQPTPEPTTPPLCEPAAFTLDFKPVIAIVEAVAVDAETLGQTALEVAVSCGYPFGAISLDRQNRLATRLGHAAPSPVWSWKHTEPVTPSARVVIPAPEAEEELDGSDVEAMLQTVLGLTEGVVVDLGCRWAPRLFRPVLTRATHIWLVVRAGQWGAVEVRLDQAEFSGWTDMKRIRLVVLGTGSPVPAQFGDMVAAVLPDLAGPAAKGFVASAVGRARHEGHS